MEYLFFAIIFGALITGIIIGEFLVIRKTKKEIETILKDEKNNYYTNLKASSSNFNHIDLVKVLKKQKDFYKNKSPVDNSINLKSNTDEFVKVRNERDRYKKERDEAQKEHKDLLYAFDKNENTLKDINKIDPNIFSKINQQKSTGFVDQKSSNTKDFVNNKDIKDTKEVSLENNISDKEEIESFSDQTTMVQQTQNELRSIIYFSIPDSNGSFNLENRKDRKDENTFYSIEYTDNSNHGTLNFISSELDIRAIDGIDFYLLPVCQIENIEIQENANEIVFDTPGKVIKRDNSWVIDPDNKVKIKFA